MSEALKQLLSENGMTFEDFTAQWERAAEGNKPFAAKRGVQSGPELRRILALPRRQWETRISEFVEPISEFFRNPDWAKADPKLAEKVAAGKATPPTLRPVQAACLAEANDYGGLFAPVRVSGGKTLITLLAPTVFEARIRAQHNRPVRAILFVPAKLIEKTRRDMHRYRNHWLVPAYIRTESYELLGRSQAAKMLEDYKPDIILADEAHRFKNTGAACTKRVKRYMEEHPETIMVALSGTITKRSIHDYAHIAAWCLKKTNPTPRDFPTRYEWSCVIDEKPRVTEDGFSSRLAPGALIEFCNEEERATYSQDPLRCIRRAYRRRLTDTPGVVATQEGPMADCSLTITSEVLTMPEAEAMNVVRVLRQQWERPDGEPILDAIELWRHLREAACGFWYRWNPSAPKEWRDARRDWAKVVREVLKHNRLGLDSESQVRRAVSMSTEPAEAEVDEHATRRNEERRRYHNYRQYADTLQIWRDISPSFQPKTEAVWFSRTVLDRCVKFLKEAEGPIVWVEHVEFGLGLAQMTGLPFFQRGGVDQFKKPIEDYEEEGRSRGVGTPIICSIQSNAEGRNMQPWRSNLVVSPPTAGSIWEQFIGRTHRDGQEADEVTVLLPIVLREQALAFERACNDARYIEDTTGQSQKLCYADIDVIAGNLAPVLPNGSF